MTPPNPLPLREILLCPVFQDDPPTLMYAVTLRKGLQFELLDLLRGDHVALIGDPRTLELLERQFQLPVRVLDAQNGAFLALKTFRARQNGTFFDLKRPLS